jgi:hypothetical protein
MASYMDRELDGGLPWNAGWGGRCEHCQHEFALETSYRFDGGPVRPYFAQVRRACFRPATRLVQYGPDCGTAEAGILITVKTTHWRGKTGEAQEVFLTKHELHELMAACHRELSVVWEQESWPCDWT